MVNPRLKKAGHGRVRGADRDVIATTSETKVHHGEGHHESVKGKTSSVIAAAEATKNHHLVTKGPPKGLKSEADAGAKHRSNLTRAVSLPDVENEAVAALVSG